MRIEILRQANFYTTWTVFGICYDDNVRACFFHWYPDASEYYKLTSDVVFCRTAPK